MSEKLRSPLTSTPENWVRFSFQEGLICCLPSTLPARVLRLLATNHIFIEVTPDVFANNRLSSVLDTGKSVEELLARLAWSSIIRVNLLTIASPESKHVGTHGMASIIELAYGLSTGSSTLSKF
jgi:hypothetical protein